MKKQSFLSLFLCLVILLSLASPALASQAQTIEVYPINVMVGGKAFLPTNVNGENVPVFTYGGTTYAPLRALAEAYGLTVGYNAEKRLATVDGTPSANFVGTKGTAQALTEPTKLEVYPIDIEVNGSIFLPKDVNGDPVPVFTYGGTTYAPLRALAESYGLTVGYDADKRLATVDFVSDRETLLLADVLTDVNAEKKALIEHEGAFNGFSAWLKADKNLLTQEEINALTNNSVSKTVSYAQAVADIDLYFRTLKYAYGAYYYFGGDSAFDGARDKAVAAIAGKSEVTSSAVAQAIFDSVNFVMDGHFSVGGPSIVEYEAYKKIYFYCDLEFCKDGDRFYLPIDGENWYVSGFSNPNVSIEYTLTADGRLIYSPALICPAPEADSDTVTLINDGKTQELTINWIRSQSMLGGYSGTFDFKTLEKDGVAYISMRSFNSRDTDTLNRFAASGADFKDAEVIIFDIRGNSGGSDMYCDMWVESFSGERIALPTAHSNRVTALSHGTLGNERIEEIYIDGKMIPNDIPILVLVDNYCASAGESMLLFLKTLENAVIIGSSSAGYQLAGNRVDLTLPNSGVPFSFGTSFSFKFDTTNVDGVGYAPDVYCDPSHALDAALALVGSDMEIEHDLSSSDPSFAPGSSRISVEFFDSAVFAGQTFGTNAGTHNITVLLDGNPVTDFTVTNTKDSVATFRAENGTLRMKVTGNGFSVLSVTVGDVTASFGVFVDNFIDFPDGLTLGFQGAAALKPGDRFGYFTGMDTIRVNVDGRRVYDFTCTIADTSVAEIIEMDGETFLYFKKNGETKLTVTAEGQTGEFTVVVNGHEDAGSPRITIDYCGIPVYAGQGFGWNTGVYDLGICLDGKPISDFTYTYETNGVIDAKREGDRIIVTVIGRGDCMITVTADGVSTTFRWAAY